MSKSKTVKRLESKARKLEQKIMVKILQEKPYYPWQQSLTKVKTALAKRKERAAKYREWRNLKIKELSNETQEPNTGPC